MKEDLVNFKNEEQKNSWKKNNYTDYIKSKIFQKKQKKNIK